MRVPFSFLLLALVLAEIAGFVIVGGAIGVGWTLALTLLAMTLGAVLLRRQGMTTLTRIRAEVAARRVPARQVAEGAILALAAVLMIVPGFITDIIGLLLFIPPVRSALWKRLSSKVQIRTAQAPGFRPERGELIELEPSEFAAAPRADSPWRRSGE